MTDYAREYDVAAAIPAFMQILADWGRRGAEARAQLSADGRGRLDLAYGASPDETLDLFLPPSQAKAPPLLVFLHGGFWRRLHKNDFAWLARPWLDAGVAVAIVNYGLAPATPLDEIVAQTRRSLAWLWHAAPAHGHDRRRMVVSGHSAGGQLAAMALATDWPGLDAALPGDMIAAAITLSPLVELAPLRKVPFLQADLHLTDALVAGCSPIRHAPAHAAPILAAVGGRESDEFKRQLKLLVEAWPQCHSRIVPMPDDDHLSICEAFGRAGTPLHAAALALLTAKR